MNTGEVGLDAQSAAEAEAALVDLADVEENEIVFPGFIIRQPEGLFADLTKLESSARFESFVERVFSAGQYFTDLDYERFLSLLYDFPLEKIAATRQGLELSKESTAIRFASDIAVFSPERRALYKTATVIDGVAEYFFEPVVLERTIEEDTEQRVVSESANLSLDEFVADMWSKGIRYGIDVAVVHEVICDGESEEVVIARPLEPVAGIDAGIEDQTDALYQDDAPKELPNGKVDLRQFKNHFPQIKKGARLLKKTPRVQGEAGRTVEGVSIEPPLPKDFDLNDLAGAGTMVERLGEGEFLVATTDGFLNIDTATNRITITTKIINRSGVSARTTGNILLDCDEYEEYGEVQEKRVVEGRNITAHADVFGTIISSGGTIALKQNLIRGSAINHDGDIVIEGLISGAVVSAKKGAVIAKRAENCTIVGKTVKLEFAVHCNILGETIEVEAIEGCAIAGKTLLIGDAGPRHESETIVSILVPDLSSFDEKDRQIAKKIEEADLVIAKKSREIDVVAGEPQTKTYLALSAKLKRNEITFTPEQAENWQKLVVNVAPSLKKIARLSEEMKGLQAGRQSICDGLAALKQSRDEASAGISCSIENIRGGVLVRTLKIKPEVKPLSDLAPKELQAALRASALPGTTLPSGKSGAFSWQCQPTDQKAE